MTFEIVSLNSNRRHVIKTKTFVTATQALSKGQNTELELAQNEAAVDVENRATKNILFGSFLFFLNFIYYTWRFKNDYAKYINLKTDATKRGHIFFHTHLFTRWVNV